MNKEIEIDESVAIQLAMLFQEPANMHLCINPISCYVKVGHEQMENN